MRIGTHMMCRRAGLLAVIVGGLAVAAGTSGARDDDWDGSGSWGAVFTLTNSQAGNALAVFGRDGQGRLAAPVFYPTGGAGTGTGLGNQGALALGEDGQYLYAVNPGSDTISVFRLGSRGPRAVQVIGSCGARLISLTVADDLLPPVRAQRRRRGDWRGGLDRRLRDRRQRTSSSAVAVGHVPQRGQHRPGPDRVQRRRSRSDRDLLC